MESSDATQRGEVGVNQARKARMAPRAAQDAAKRTYHRSKKRDKKVPMHAI